MQRILVTGAAGFIGYHLSERLLAEGYTVTGLDNLNAYYDPALKGARLDRLRRHAGFQFILADLGDRDAMEECFAEGKFDVVVHLAAQAGVRYSLEDPYAYANSNLTGFLHILEGCRNHPVKHLLFASSSSVYGAHTHLPYSTHVGVDHPISLYAATKKSNELMAHAYSHLFRIPSTGLRFFTVYGPWGRPDMALFKFTRAILAGEPIDIYNEGQMRRDFTYIDDVVEAVLKLIPQTATAEEEWYSDAPDPASSNAPYRIYNIGHNTPVILWEMIAVLEKALGKKAEKNLLPIQPGDVVATWADISDLQRAIGYHPQTPIEVGIQRFVEWYQQEYIKLGVTNKKSA